MTKKQGHPDHPTLTERLRPKTLGGLKAFFQRTSFVLEMSADLEIGNHSAAGALAFLLSAVPALLLSFGLADLLLQIFPEDTKEFQSWIARFLGPINLPNAMPKIFGQGFFALGTLAAVVGLLFSSRQFFSSIRKTLKVIWGNPENAPSMMDSVAGFLLELGSLVLLVTVLALSEAARTLVYANQDELDPHVFTVMTVLLSAVSFLILWIFFYVTLRLFPLIKPARRPTALASLAAVALFSVSAAILRAAVNTDQYELLYGVIANLVVVLLNVSVFFSLYFMTATYLFVEQHFDALLFGRYYRHWGKESLPFPDNLLFRNPRRLKELYSRSFAPGDLLFEAGDQGRTAFFVESGEVEIVIAASTPSVVDVIRQGQIFGETASILGEPRNATARAKTQLTVLELPAEVFGFYLRTDRSATKKILGTLADRLKRANSRTAP